MAQSLSSRGREILVSFAWDMPWGIRPVTVRNAVSRIRDKLKAGSMRGLALWTVQNGFVDDHGADG